MPITGAGNPAGSGGSAGVGKGLNYIGNHAFAYSGEHSATAGGFTTMLNFTTGNGYVVANVTFGNTSSAADHIEFEIIVNGKTIMAAAGDVIGEGYPLNPFEILIPPYAKIEVKTINASGGADRTVFAAITGRVYR